MQEIERKFLVKDSKEILYLPSEYIIQAYFLYASDGTARVRIVNNKTAVLTIKKDISDIRRWEFEYNIPLEDARIMVEKLSNGKIIEKRRADFLYAGKKWEIDIYSGKNEGLIMAEIELKSEDESFEKPPWLGKEVTADKRYLNACLAEKPFLEW
ncbi:MAG: CYTH domain-containing protein [Candidatus Neomarinimicrobiota bacterium]